MFDRETVRLLHERMQTALDPLGRELNVKFLVGNARYTADNVRFKVEAASIQANGEVVDETVADFKRLAPLYGLKATDLGREVVINGREFVITGLKPRSHSYPILARCKRSGKIFKLPQVDVMRALDSSP